MNKKDEVVIDGIKFSRQEMSVVQELKKGATYREVAEKLSVSVKTVDYHVKNLKEKTKANSRKELLDFFEKNKENIVMKKVSFLSNDRRFLQALILILFGLLIVVLGLYSREQKSVDEVTNVSNFSVNLLNRPRIENKIIRKLKWQKGIRTVVIFGTGGAGKTTIARKVLSQLQGNLKFEVNAETEKTIYNSFMELADYLAVSSEQRREIDIIRNLQEVDYRKKRLIRLISVMLKQKNDWVLLFDNVRLFEHIREYFPVNEEIWGRGCVLITTRNQNLEDNNYLTSSSMVNIGRLEEQEKRELFSNIVFEKGFSALDFENRKKISEFLTMIPEFPLDVSAVAYYIKNTHISLEEYTQLLRKSINELNAEQRDLMRENSGYSETRYGIISSSLREVLSDKKEYKLLLMALCFLDSQNIPKYLLKDIGGTINADNFIRKLKEKSLVMDTGAEISIHRSNHKIGYDYIREILTDKELAAGMHVIIKSLFSHAERKLTLLPHLEVVLSKISNIKGKKVAGDKTRLLLLMAEILRIKSYRMGDALSCLNKVIEINDAHNCLGEYNLARIKFRIGEIYTVMSKISLADKYLSESLKMFEDNTAEKVHAYTMLGIVRMRQKEFDKSNLCFTTALSHLQSAQIEEIQKGLLEASIYENMSFNYFMDGINRSNARTAVVIMKKAIKVLDHKKFDNVEAAVSRRGVHKIKLAGIYNALALYQQALDMAQQTEDMINKSGYDNADTLYVKAIIARERGLSNLRLNRVSRAYRYFEESKAIFTKLMKGDYLFKLKCHEAECLIRLNRLDEAMKVCEVVFNENDRERNNYSDLFYDTCLYHAAVAEYRRKNFDAARKYFSEFFRNIRVLCKEILESSTYRALNRENAFCEDSEEMRDYFQNSLKVFEAIYWKDYELTKYYVEKNIFLVKKEDRTNS